MKFSKLIQFSLTMLLRDWRSGDVRALLYATILAVTSITTVTFFTDRIQQALVLQASELLAADLRLKSDSAIREDLTAQAVKLNLSTAQFKTFRSMALYKDRPELVEVKAISQTYPLRGVLKLQRIATANRVLSLEYRENNSGKSPASGTVWIDKALQEQLGIQLNELIRLGSQDFKVVAFITKEPDRASDMFSIAPRAIIALSDLESTQLIQEGSRIAHYLLLAGDPGNVNAYRDWVTPKLLAGERIEGVKDARNEIRVAMQRAEQFFGLVAVVSLLLSLTAIGIAARRYAERNVKLCAIIRCLGSKQRDINLIFLCQLISIGLVASVVGVFLGWVSHHVIAALLGKLLLVSLPSPSYWPVASGVLIGTLGVLIIALPPVLHLKNIPTLTVLRRDIPALSMSAFRSYAVGVVLVCGIIYWLAMDAKLAGILIIGIIATLIILGLVTLAVLYLLRLLPTSRMRAWGIGIRNLSRHPLRNINQILAFGVAMMALLLLTMIRGDLLNLWQNTIPENTPNRFLINIQAHQVDQINQYFVENGLPQVSLYPIVRARFTAINGEPLSEKRGLKNQRELTQREYKLSWATQVQADNRVVEGQWWSAGDGNHQLSVEKRMAASLGVGIGDELTFSIADTPVSAKITSIRTVQWDSFKPNFYVLTTPGMLVGQPVSYITSVYIDEKNSPLISGLIKRFPNLTVINVSELMQHIRDIIERVSLAVEYMFFLTVLTGFVLLITAIQVSYDQRRQESAVMRALGASRQQIFQAVIAEFLVLGAISGFIAVLFSGITAHVMADRLFHQTYYPGIEYWLWGILSGAIGIAMLGRFSLRKVVQDSPIRSLMG